MLGIGLLEPYSVSLYLPILDIVASFLPLGQSLKTGRHCSLVSDATIFVMHNLHVQIGRSGPHPHKYAGD